MHTCAGKKAAIKAAAEKRAADGDNSDDEEEEEDDDEHHTGGANPFAALADLKGAVHAAPFIPHKYVQLVIGCGMCLISFCLNCHKVKWALSASLTERQCRCHIPSQHVRMLVHACLSLPRNSVAVLQVQGVSSGGLGSISGVQGILH